MKTGWVSKEVLGSALIKRREEIVLTIGADQWSRQDVIESLKCSHIQAARNLSRVAATLNVRNARHMAQEFSVDDLFQQSGVGVVTLFVWMCVVESLGRNPIRWLGQKKPRTLATIKKRSQPVAEEVAHG